MMSHVHKQPASTFMHASRPKQVLDAVDHHLSCHRKRLRTAALPALFLLAVAAVLIFLEYWSFAGAEGPVGATAGLLRRAVTGTTTNGNHTGLVKNKLYLIIVFVGLFLALIAAIMLSFWCCKSSFENPICCPCYLCACCGGLACLECLSCGLCAEGIADVV